MGVVIRRWVWLEFIGVVSGCFPHITYISLLHLYLFFFAAASLLLFHFVKMIFRSCLCYFCAILYETIIGDDKKNVLKFINN